MAKSGGFETADYKIIKEAAATEGELLSSVPDQSLGSDPGTGQLWGLTGDSGTFGALAPGKHNVYAGYYDPRPYANRPAGSRSTAW